MYGNPIRRPIAVPVPPPTAASASFPRNWPTTTASTVLYSCWKKVPSRIGKKNERSCFQITPSVIPFLLMVSVLTEGSITADACYEKMVRVFLIQVSA